MHPIEFFLEKLEEFKGTDRISYSTEKDRRTGRRHVKSVVIHDGSIVDMKSFSNAKDFILAVFDDAVEISCTDENGQLRPEEDVANEIIQKVRESPHIIVGIEACVVPETELSDSQLLCTLLGEKLIVRDRAPVDYGDYIDITLYDGHPNQKVVIRPTRAEISMAIMEGAP